MADKFPVDEVIGSQDRGTRAVMHIRSGVVVDVVRSEEDVIVGKVFIENWIREGTSCGRRGCCGRRAVA